MKGFINTSGNFSPKMDDIDMSMLRHNLTLSHQQRIEQHQSALDLFMTLHEAGKRYYEQSQSTAQSAAR